MPDTKRDLSQEIEEVRILQVIDFVPELMINAPEVVGADPLLDEEPVVVRVDLDDAQKTALAVLQPGCGFPDRELALRVRGKDRH